MRQYVVSRAIKGYQQHLYTANAKRCLRCWQPSLFYVNMTVFEEPAYRSAVCFVPGFHPFLFGHLGSLIQFHMAAVTQCCNAVIMCLDSSTLTIPKLV